MSTADRLKWDERFATRVGTQRPPEPYLIQHASWLHPGSVLDVASGDGRNAVALAKLGFEVTAVDISTVALTRLQEFAQSHDLPIRTLVRDLDDADALDHLPAQDNLVVLRFKPPADLWPRLGNALRPGGRLLLCTYNQEQHRHHGFPQRFCLQEAELVDAARLHPELRLVEHISLELEDNFSDGYRFERGI